MHLFYVPNITSPDITLNETESKHAVTVMRLKKGDLVQVVDGSGGLYTAGITEPHSRRCRLTVLKTHQEYEKRNFRLHIAIAPTKNIDRMEWFLEKATEIGIDEITPVLCEHSERKIINPERLEKILVSAMKQSFKAYLPRLNKLTSYMEFISRGETSQKFIAHCNEAEKAHLKNLVKKESPVLVLIGPEGDFSPAEVKEAKRLGFIEVSLGNSRLRTETAGVVACHIVNLVNE